MSHIIIRHDDRGCDHLGRGPFALKPVQLATTVLVIPFSQNHPQGRQPVQPFAVSVPPVSVYYVRFDDADIRTHPLYRNVPSVILAHHYLFLPGWKYIRSMFD